MSHGKILVVEDDKFTARMMELQFQKHGFDITVAPNGQDALDCLENQSFDLVMSDVVMPNISGLDLLRQIREKHDKESLPVLLVTGMENSPKINEAYRLGVNDFFTKPKDFSHTMHRVTLHVEMRRMREALKHQGGTSSEAQGLKDSPVRGPGDGLWDWDMSRGHMQFSNRWKAILGFEASEFEPSMQAWQERVHPEDLPSFTSAFEEHKMRKTPWLELDYRIRDKQDRYIWVHTFGVALFSKTGQAARMLGSMSVCIQYKELEAQWDQQRHMLATLSDSFARFGKDTELDEEGRARLEHLGEALNQIKAHANQVLQSQE